MFHTDVYAVADRLRIHGLKTLAEDCFRRSAQTICDFREVPKAIGTVYKVAPPGEQGDSFRAIAIGSAVQYARQLFADGKDFSSLLEEQAEVGRDLSKALSREIHDLALIALQC